MWRRPERRAHLQRWCGFGVGAVLHRLGRQNMLLDDSPYGRTCVHGMQRACRRSVDAVRLPFGRLLPYGAYACARTQNGGSQARPASSGGPMCVVCAWGLSWGAVGRGWVACGVRRGRGAWGREPHAAPRRPAPCRPA
jgi:hypothetical protein